MPAFYDIKSIGDQLHQIGLELEVEKVITDTIVAYLKGTQGFDPKKVFADAKTGAEAGDAETQLLLSLLENRYSRLHSL